MTVIRCYIELQTGYMVREHANYWIEHDLLEHQTHKDSTNLHCTKMVHESCLELSVLGTFNNFLWEAVDNSQLFFISLYC